LGTKIGEPGEAANTDSQQEGFSPDPYLTGAMIGPTVEGIQSAGVIATTKHYIANEQEHFRQVGESIGYGFNITATLSSNIDDKTMHEIYLWPFADAVRAGTGSSKRSTSLLTIATDHTPQSCAPTSRSTTPTVVLIHTP